MSEGYEGEVGYGKDGDDGGEDRIRSAASQMIYDDARTISALRARVAEMEAALERVEALPRVFPEVGSDGHAVMVERLDGGYLRAASVFAALAPVARHLKKLPADAPSEVRGEGDE